MLEQDKAICILLESLKNSAINYVITNTGKCEIQEIAEKLVKLDYYPESTPYMKKHNKTLADMVFEFGINWIEYSMPKICPNCCEDLRSEDGPPFKKEIAIIDYEMNMIVDEVCPSCKHSIKTGREYSEEELEHTNYFNRE